MKNPEDIRRWTASWLRVDAQLGVADARELAARWRMAFGIARRRHGSAISNSVRDPRAVGERALFHLQKELVRAPTGELLIFSPSHDVALVGVPVPNAATVVAEGLADLQHECVVMPSHGEWSFLASRYDWDLFLIPQRAAPAPNGDEPP